MTKMQTVDCRGLACPEPVINTKDALLNAASPIQVVVDNEASCTNVKRFAMSQGASVSVTQRDGDFFLTIEPGRGSPESIEPRVECVAGATPKTVAFIASEGIGRGDDELGAVLMKAFLDTLSQFKDETSHAIFVNSGAKLTVEGSPVMDQIKQLEQIGVEVLVCGTCLDYFGIKDKLKAGSVSNMYAIIETLLKAGKIIRP